MIWRGLLVEKQVRDDAIVRAFASVFGAPADSVRVVDDVMAASTGETTGATILIERRAVHGQASLALDVYLVVAATERRGTVHITSADDVALVGSLASHLRTSIITDDDDLDPSSYRRVGPDGSVQSVRLDDERLEDGRVVVIQPRAARSGAA